MVEKLNLSTREMIETIKSNYPHSGYEMLRESLDRCLELLNLAEKGLLVELPCKVGDTVYIIGKCKDFPEQLDGSLYDSDGGFGDATGYYCPYEQNCPFETDDCNEVKDKQAIFEDMVVHICIEEDRIWFVCENSNGWNDSCFGKNIFLTESEAEQALADIK